jgi:hypothetical protein
MTTGKTLRSSDHSARVEPIVDPVVEIVLPSDLAKPTPGA